MLSVQSAGCAGMERLGVPARTTLNTPPDDRGLFSRRMRADVRELQTVIRSSNINSGSNISSNNYHHHHQHHLQRMSAASGCGLSGSNSIHIGSNKSSSQATTINNSNNARNTSNSMGSNASSMNSRSHDHHQHYQYQLQQQRTLRCPHHVPLPDSEWGQDRDLQIRSRYQQSEITRSYIKPPPNKTIKDVPEQSSYNFYALTSHAAPAATLSQVHYNSALQQQHHSIGCNPGTSSSSSSISPSSSSSTLLSPTATCSNSNQHVATAIQQQHKSKPSVITKLFSRKSSPKSPTALCSTPTSCTTLVSSASLSSMPTAATSAQSPVSCASSSSSVSSVSTSSSASSLSSAQLLPISTASAVTTTPCSFGTSLATPTNTANNILAGLAPTTQLLTTIGVSATAAATAPTPTLLRIPTPPLSVSVPATHQHQQQQQQHKHYQQQQQHLPNDSSEGSGNSSTAAEAVAMDCRQLLPAIRQQSLSPAAGRSSSSASSEFQSAAAAVGSSSGISRNSSNCSMDSYNCSCSSNNSVACPACGSHTATSQRQQSHVYDQQHTL